MAQAVQLAVKLQKHFVYVVRVALAQVFLSTSADDTKVDAQETIRFSGFTDAIISDYSFAI
jgi:hypothetical protein